MLVVILLLLDGEDGDHFIEQFFALLIHTLQCYVCY